jgi:two-component system CheB/CheR fusion protein
MGISTDTVSELDHIGDWGLLSTDSSLAISGWNRWFERHTGLADAAVRGRSIFDVFPDLVSRRFDSYYRQALGGQTVVLAQRFHRYLLSMPPSYPGTGLERMQQTARIMPLRSGETICGTLTVIEDVTERVAHEAELAKRIEELQETDRRKDEFLAMLAHELRNPLAPLRNTAQIFRHAATDPARREWCSEVIERQVAHLGRLVDDLLDVARVSRGKIQLQLAPVDLPAVVDAAVETVRSMYDGRRQNLTVRFPDRPLRLTGDAARLTQVLINLLNNASKYSPEGAQVFLDVDTEPGRIVIRVKDPGAGIPREMLTKVFELFMQADRTLDRSQGGLGIGLTLVHRLVLLHGGTVEVQSDGLGLGSEFIVRLPAPAQETSRRIAGPPSVATAADAKKKILVMDDNVDTAESLAVLLQINGHEVRTATDGVSGVRLAEEFRPSVVFCDIGLPGMDGYAVARALREKFGASGILLVAASGYGQEEDRRRSLAAGFDHHLTKPFEYQKVTGLLGRGR